MSIDDLYLYKHIPFSGSREINMGNFSVSWATSKFALIKICFRKEDLCGSFY